MTDDTTVFLTPERRAVLNGEYDGADNTKRTHQSRIRARAQAAIHELIEVAESDAIDNENVFHPPTVHHLLSAIYLGGSGVEPYHPSEEYQNALYAELAGFFIRETETFEQVRERAQDATEDDE